MLLDAWTTYDEPLLCKIHENIKNLSLRGMNIELSKLHEGVEISTLKCAVWYQLYNYEYNYDLMHWNRLFHFSMQPYDLSDAYTASVWNNVYIYFSSNSCIQFFIHQKFEIPLFLSQIHYSWMNMDMSELQT